MLHDFETRVAEMSGQPPPDCSCPKQHQPAHPAPALPYPQETEVPQFADPLFQPPPLLLDLPFQPRHDGFALELPPPGYPNYPTAFPGAHHDHDGHEKKGFFKKHVSEPFANSFKESWKKASDKQQEKARVKDNEEWRKEKQRRQKVIGGDADEHKGFCVIV
jgi:hypothetical protein